MQAQEKELFSLSKRFHRDMGQAHTILLPSFSTIFLSYMNQVEFFSPVWISHASGKKKKALTCTLYACPSRLSVLLLLHSTMPGLITFFHFSFSECVVHWLHAKQKKKRRGIAATAYSVSAKCKCTSLVLEDKEIFFCFYLYLTLFSFSVRTAYTLWYEVELFFFWFFNVEKI